MRPWLFVVLLLTLAAPCRADEPRSWALIVGVNEYNDGLLNRLDYCVNDARLIYRALTGPCHVSPDQVVLMSDDAREQRLLPFQRQVMAEVDRLSRLAGPADTLIVFFSGHGVPDGKGGVVLATRDCEKGNAALTGVGVDWLKQVMESSKAGRKLLVLDCCHAGAARSGGDGVKLAPCFEHARGLVTLASCAPDELSQEWPDVRQGLFTYFLCKGLEGGADLDANSVIDADELYKFVYNHVAETALKVRRVRQHPQLYRGADTTGVFALARLDRDRAAYPIRAKAGQAFRRKLVYTERYTLNDPSGAWSAEYREAVEMRTVVKQTDAAGRPTHLEVKVLEHDRRTNARLPSGSRFERRRGPWSNRIVIQELRPGGAVSLLIDRGDREKTCSLAHPLLIDESLLPEVRLKTGDAINEPTRITDLLAKVAPDANARFDEPPVVTLKRTEEGGRVLVFTGAGKGSASVALPQQTPYDVSWAVEYVPDAHYIRTWRVNAESKRVRQGTQDVSLVVTCEGECKPE